MLYQIHKNFYGVSSNLEIKTNRQGLSNPYKLYGNFTLKDNGKTDAIQIKCFQSPHEGGCGLTYDDKMGVAYDTIFFGILLFGYETTYKSFEKKFRITDKDFESYFDLKKSIPKPPDDIYPFFFCDWTKACVLSEYFFYHFHFGQDDFGDFLHNLTHERREMKRAVFEYYLEKSFDESLFEINNAFKLTKLILNLNYEQNLLLKLIEICTDYDRVFDGLLCFLKDTYEKVKEFHQNRIKDIDVRYFLSKEMCNKLNVFLNVEYINTCKKHKVSLCFLHPFVILYKGDPDLGLNLILGYKCEDQIATMVSFNKASPQLICEALGNPVKAQILEKLREGEYTASQLSELLFVSRQSVNRHLLWLNGQMFVRVSKRVGPEIYYEINSDFFKAAKTILYQYAKSFEKNTLLAEEAGAGKRYKKLEND